MTKISYLLNDELRIETDNGDVRHFLKKTGTGYNGFGEVYLSELIPYGVKAWKYHKIMTANILVVSGEIGFVFKTEKGFQTLILNDKLNKRLTIPPKVWFGFKNIVSIKSILINFSDIVHDTKESISKPIDYFNFDWSSF